MQVERAGLAGETPLSRLSGGRVSNAWITYPRDRDNTGKLVLIPGTLLPGHPGGRKGGLWCKLPLADGSASYQLVGGVTAHQGDDG